MQKDIVNECGEVIDHLYEGDRILRKQSKEFISDTVEINQKEPYVKAYIAPLFQISKLIDGTTNQLMNLIVFNFLSYETGILQHGNGKPLTRKCIVELSGLNEKTVDKSISKLIELQVLGKHKTGRFTQYTANPFIFMKGRRVNKTLVKMFENSRWAMKK